jgi:hypothetical protein
VLNKTPSLVTCIPALRMIVRVVPVLLALSLAAPQPPVWIQRAKVPQPIVAWRLADVLGTPVVEGIAVDRDAAADALTVSVVDSRFDPPRIVHQRDLKGSRVRWLRAGKRDGLHRRDIAVDVVDHGEERAYLLLARRGFRLELVRTVRGQNISRGVFAR